MQDDTYPTSRVEIEDHATVYGPVVGFNSGTINNIVQIAEAVTSLHQLPASPADFVGRQAEIAELVAALRRPAPGTAALAAICGMGGLGKTELAVRVGHALREYYPDAQLFISLRSSSTGSARSANDALRDAIHAFEPSAALPDNTTALGERYRGLLGGHRALVVLDDVGDEASVRSFIPPAGCALLVTSRTRLTLGGLGVTINLALFSRDESRALLLDDVPELRGDDALEGILERCGDLPLALRVAGSTLRSNPALTPARYLARLSDEARRPGALRYEDTDVYAVLGLGDDLLHATNPALARRWRMLAVCPAPFDRAAAATIWEERDEDALDDTLGLLIRRSLARYDPDKQQYRVHDLLRDVARTRWSPEDEHIARLRHARHFLAIYREAQRRYDDPAEDTLTSLKLFDAAWAHIRGAAAWLAATPATETDELCVYAPQNQSILDIRLQPQELIAWCEACAAAGRRRGNRRDEALALHGLGNGNLDVDFHKAREAFEQCLAIARELGDRKLESWALNGLGTAAGALGDYQQAVAYYEQVLNIRRELGNKLGQAKVLNNLGMAHGKAGDFQQATEYFNQSLAFLEHLDDRQTQAIVLNNLGNVYILQGTYEHACDWIKQSIVIARALGDKRIESDASWTMGEALIGQGKFAEALEFMRLTVAYERQIGHPHAEQDARTLAETEQKAADSHSAAGRAGV